jgi:hypothetical protein
MECPTNKSSLLLHLGRAGECRKGRKRRTFINLWSDRTDADEVAGRIWILVAAGMMNAGNVTGDTMWKVPGHPDWGTMTQILLIGITRDTTRRATFPM